MDMKNLTGAITALVTPFDAQGNVDFEALEHFVDFQIEQGIDGIRCHSGSLRAMTAEGQVVGIADRIAYVTHDIDDAKRAGLLTEEALPAGPRALLGNSSSERIETMVHDIVKQSAQCGDIRMSDTIWTAMMQMRSFLFGKLWLM